MTRTVTARHACPCCGFLTLSAPPPGTFTVCPVGCWEDDDIQYRYPDYAGGANEVSLQEARINFHVFGAASVGASKYVRQPLPDELPAFAR